MTLGSDMRVVKVVLVLVVRATENGYGYTRCPMDTDYTTSATTRPILKIPSAG